MNSFLLLILYTAFAADLDPRLVGLEAKMDAFVQKFQPVENTGIAVGVLLDGKWAFYKGYGFRDR